MQQQRGAVLIIALIFLLLLTILGITAIRTSSYEQKMSGNNVDKEQSFGAAETALIDAENWLLNLATLPVASSSCSSQPCVLILDPTRYPESQLASWWSSNSYSVTTSLPQLAQQPAYVIEFERYVNDDDTVGKGYQPSGVAYYRITSRGIGKTGASKTILQGNIARR